MEVKISKETALIFIELASAVVYKVNEPQALERFTRLFKALKEVQIALEGDKQSV
jgi:hypothetical protein